MNDNPGLDMLPIYLRMSAKERALLLVAGITVMIDRRTTGHIRALHTRMPHIAASQLIQQSILDAMGHLRTEMASAPEALTSAAHLLHEALDEAGIPAQGRPLGPTATDLFHLIDALFPVEGAAGHPTPTQAAE
jgi:hypothetical protein